MNVPRAALPTARTGLIVMFLVIACGLAPRAATRGDDHFATAERARYAALCHARKDLDSCSDAVRWSPSDPALIVILADALARARRLPEAIRDYRRAEELAPAMRGVDSKLKAAEALLAEKHTMRRPKPAAAPADPVSGQRYSNVEPDAQSH
jgi:tetratricopeptide (TPR) repeat protein